MDRFPDVMMEKNGEFDHMPRLRIAKATRREGCVVQ